MLLNGKTWAQAAAGNIMPASSKQTLKNPAVCLWQKEGVEFIGFGDLGGIGFEREGRNLLLWHPKEAIPAGGKCKVCA